MQIAKKILKVGNSRAIVLDKAIANALGLDLDSTEVSITIESGKVTIYSARKLDALDVLRSKLATYSEEEARKIAVQEVAAVRPATVRRWKKAV